MDLNERNITKSWFWHRNYGNGFNKRGSTSFSCTFRKEAPPPCRYLWHNHLLEHIPKDQILEGSKNTTNWTPFFQRRNVNPLRLIVDLKFRYQSDAWLPVDGYSVYTIDFTDPQAKKHLRLLEAGGIKFLTPTSHELPWNNDIWIGILLHRLEKKASLSSASKSRMVSLFILWLKDKIFFSKSILLLLVLPEKFLKPYWPETGWRIFLITRVVFTPITKKTPKVILEISWECKNIVISSKKKISLPRDTSVALLKFERVWQFALGFRSSFELI